MEKALNKIKAVAKILAGVIIALIIGSLIAVTIALMTGAGALGLALGAFIMIGSTAFGAFIGGKWARVNVAGLENTRGVAIGSASVYFIVSFMILGAGRVLSAMLGDTEINFWTQVAQISLQSFMIYVASHFAMKQFLPKKKIIE